MVFILCQDGSIPVLGPVLTCVSCCSIWLLSTKHPLYSVQCLAYSWDGLPCLLTLHNFKYRWLALMPVPGHLCLALQNLTLLHSLSSPQLDESPWDTLPPTLPYTTLFSYVLCSENFSCFHTLELHHLPPTSASLLLCLASLSWIMVENTTRQTFRAVVE